MSHYADWESLVSEISQLEGELDAIAPQTIGELQDNWLDGMDDARGNTIAEISLRLNGISRAASELEIIAENMEKNRVALEDIAKVMRSRSAASMKLGSIQAALDTAGDF